MKILVCCHVIIPTEAFSIDFILVRFLSSMYSHRIGKIILLVKILKNQCSNFQGFTVADEDSGVFSCDHSKRSVFGRLHICKVSLQYVFSSKW